MTDPVHEMLAAAVKGSARLEHALDTVWHDITSHHAHPHYDSDSDPKGPDMSVLTDFEDKIRQFGADVQAKIEDLVTTGPPVIHAAAETIDRWSQSKIVSELENLAAPLDPALEEALATAIRVAGSAAQTIANLSAPPAPAAEPGPAGPPSADAQPQTYVAQ